MLFDYMIEHKQKSLDNHDLFQHIGISIWKTLGFHQISHEFPKKSKHCWGHLGIVTPTNHHSHIYIIYIIYIFIYLGKLFHIWSWLVNIINIYIYISIFYIWVNNNNSLTWMVEVAAKFSLLWSSFPKKWLQWIPPRSSRMFSSAWSRSTDFMVISSHGLAENRGDFHGIWWLSMGFHGDSSWMLIFHGIWWWFNGIENGLFNGFNGNISRYHCS